MNEQSSPYNITIDITGQAVPIPQPTAGAELPVPPWPHFYVYSYEDLERASPEQKKYYAHFRQRFIDGVYPDLKGNLNYAFILLFDLLRQSETDRTLYGLTRQLKALAENYRKTWPYCRSLLQQRYLQRGDREGLARMQASFGYAPPLSEFEYAEYRLGAKYKEILFLNDEQERILNYLWDPANNFCSIGYCMEQLVKLFLYIVKAYDKELAPSGTTLEQVISEVAGTVASSQFRYRPGSTNYEYTVTSVTGDIFRLLFKHCENALRERYAHKRKINADNPYRGTAGTALEQRVLAQLPALMARTITKIPMPDEPTEVELNAQNATRWKLHLEQLGEEWGTRPALFEGKVIYLAKLNARNPSLENIFFEASRFIAPVDRQVALSLYLRYLHCDLLSTTFDNRGLTKALQKSLFRTADELTHFGQLVGTLLQDRDLKKALSALPAVFEPRRKRIELDHRAIREVNERHGSTVDLLGQLLADDSAEAPASAQAASGPAPAAMPAMPPSVSNRSGPALSPVQEVLLDLFEKGGGVISEEDMDGFARANGVFKNSLVSAVNESYYELLDDVLIEEEDGSFVINQFYLNKINLS